MFCTASVLALLCATAKENHSHRALQKKWTVNEMFSKLRGISTSPADNVNNGPVQVNLM